MVDFSACVDDEFLQQLAVEKGSRRIVSVEERGEILAQLDGAAYQVSLATCCSSFTVPAVVTSHVVYPCVH